MEQILVSYLSLSVFPWPIDEIDREDLHAQPPLNAIHHYMQAFTVADYKAWVVQFVRHLFEVQVGILRYRQKSASETSFQNLINNGAKTDFCNLHCQVYDRLVHV